MVARYRRVAQTENPEEQDVKKKRADRIERITSKLHAIVWIAASVAIIVYTQIFQNAMSDIRVNRTSLYAAVVCLVANLGIILYLTIWIPLVLKVTAPWDIYCPHLIPISTGLGLLCFILFMIALWPIYGMLTPLIITILLMGFLFTTHFVPWPC